MSNQVEKLASSFDFNSFVVIRPSKKAFMRAAAAAAKLFQSSCMHLIAPASSSLDGSVAQ